MEKENKTMEKEQIEQLKKIEDELYNIAAVIIIERTIAEREPYSNKIVNSWTNLYEALMLLGEEEYNDK